MIFFYVNLSGCYAIIAFFRSHLLLEIKLSRWGFMKVSGWNIKTMQVNSKLFSRPAAISEGVLESHNVLPNNRNSRDQQLLPSGKLT